MGFFSHKHTEAQEQGQGRRRSVRDLEAQAYARWVAEGSKPRQSSTSSANSFDVQRALRRAALEEGDKPTVVLRT
jgi:hypothetical protein